MLPTEVLLRKYTHALICYIIIIEIILRNTVAFVVTFCNFMFSLNKNPPYKEYLNPGVQDKSPVCVKPRLNTVDTSSAYFRYFLKVSGENDEYNYFVNTVVVVNHHR